MRHVPSARVPLLALVLLAGTAVPSRAELVWLTTGRTMSVKSHRVDGDTVTLVLRQGGEVTCPANLVARVDADEVPYPEPRRRPRLLHRPCRRRARRSPGRSPT